MTTGTAPTGQPTYVIDNGGDLKFSVIRGGALSSTLHLADISSIQYKNREMLAPYATTSRYSHYEQGLGSTTAISYTVDPTNGWILVKCDDSIASDDSAIQYYAVRRNDNNLYMASLPTNVNGGPGEGRFIAYLSRPVFANPEEPSDLAGNTGAIEGGDVFGFADGTTASKFYNMGRRMIENEYHGVTGSAGGTPVGAWMSMGNRERSAGGPFFKDIDFQAGSAVEIYNCIFTGHTQTEAYRQGLHTYAMQFTDGSAPVKPDYAWLDNVKDAGGNLLIGGLIPTSQRGAISGNATGNPAGHETVVTLSNAEAQYWDMADAAGNYSITGVLPGTYAQTLYSNELAVGTRTVTIAAGQTTRANIANTYHTPPSTWRIGAWDGTPVGFLNADKIEVMHPSDVRMSSWTSTPNFVVGANTDAQWPMAQFMGVNNGQRVTFNLTAAQAATAQTLRIGITLGFEGGRNRVTVNAGQSYAWTSAIPSASRDLNSRGITRGTWRGDNQLYTYDIPAGALRAGTNTIDLPVVSGSYVAGQTWLSPNVVYDAIDLVPTPSLTNAPRVTTIAVSPANVSLGVSGTRQFTAVARDQFGNVAPSNVTWSTTRGTIDDSGAYQAPATPGSGTVTAAAGAVSGSTNVSVLANPTDIAWYKADVSSGAALPDSSGNGFTAGLAGAYGFVPGVNGNAVRLTGGAATLPAGIVGTLDDFTVATWVKLDGQATWARIFDFGTTPAAGNPQAYMFLAPQSATGRPRFAITTASGGGEQVVDSSVAMTTGAWTHVAVTLSGNTATLYIDGVARGTNAAMTLRPSSLGHTANNYIGDSQWAADPALLGSVDDFRIYARALSPAEVGALADDDATLPAWLAPGSTATWDATTKSLTVTGAATITADPGADAPIISANGTAAVLTIDPSSGRAVHVGGLALTGGATATLASVTSAAATAAPTDSTTPALRGGGYKGNAKPKPKQTSLLTATTSAVRTAATSRVLVVNGNTFIIDATSRLDLADNNLVLNYSGASPAAGVEGMVKAGFNGGDWLGKRITSSVANVSRNFALAVSDNARLAIPFDGTRLFAGQAVDATSVLVKFTHRVDLDLDGVITTNDATIFNGNFSEGGTSRWALGDVDFDGLFTTNDATLFNGFYDESLGAM